jgi:hypothetical protein
MFHAASLRIGNREEYARVVALFKDAGGRSHRQHAGLLDVVYHLHRFAPPHRSGIRCTPVGSTSPPSLSTSLPTVYPTPWRLDHQLCGDDSRGSDLANELPTPLVWIEHWPEESTEGQETFDLVVFSSYEVVERAPYLGETRAWIGDAT